MSSQYGREGRGGGLLLLHGLDESGYGTGRTSRRARAGGGEAGRRAGWGSVGGARTPCLLQKGLGLVLEALDFRLPAAPQSSACLGEPLAPRAARRTWRTGPRPASQQRGLRDPDSVM